MCCGERVEGEEAERRLAVDKNDVVIAEHGLERALQCVLASHLAHELELCGRQIDIARQQVEILDIRVHDHFVDMTMLVGDQVVDGEFKCAWVDPEGDGDCPLRIEVDEEHTSAVAGEGRAEAHGGGRLSDATLLVHHRDDARRPMRHQRLRLRNVGRRARVVQRHGPEPTAADLHQGCNRQ